MTLLATLFFALVACDDDLSDYDDADADLLPVDQAPVPPVFSQIGTCPGVVTFNITGFTPSGGYAIARSPNLAPGVTIPSGPCTGTALRIGPPTVLVASGTAPPSGNLSFTFTLGPAACGQYLQAVDLNTCIQSMYHQIF